MSQSPGEDLPNDPEAPGPRHGKHAKPAPSSSQDTADSAAPSEPTAADETESPETTRSEPLPSEPEPAPEPTADEDVSGSAPEEEAEAAQPDEAENEPHQAAAVEPEAAPPATTADAAEAPADAPQADETGPEEIAAPEPSRTEQDEPSAPTPQEPERPDRPDRPDRPEEPAPPQTQARPERPSPATPPPAPAQPAWDALPPTATRQQPLPAMPQAATPQSRDEDPDDRQPAATQTPPPSSPPQEPQGRQEPQQRQEPQEPVTRRSSETIQFEPPAVSETPAKTTQEESRDDWFQPRTRPEPPASPPPAPRHARPQPSQAPQSPRPAGPPPQGFPPDQGQHRRQPQAQAQPQSLQPQPQQQPQQPAQGQPQAYQQTPRPAQGQPQAFQQPQGPDQGQPRQPWDQPQRIAPPRPPAPPARPSDADPQVTRPNPQPAPNQPDVRPSTRQGSGSYPTRTEGQRPAQGGGASYQPSAWQQPREAARPEPEWQPEPRPEAEWRPEPRPEPEWQPAAHMQAGAWTSSYQERPDDWHDGGQQAVALREHQGWEPQRAEEPRQVEAGRRRSKGKVPAIVGGALVVLLGALVGVQLMRPVPAPKVKLTLASSHTFAGQSPTLPWPNNTGQAAVDVAGIGTMGTMGAETPTPTASVAKVMTAYIFLKDHPLPEGQDGPTFTIGAAEASRLKWRQQRQESLVIVKAGQQFTERQALEALLVVSANNVAHEIARWEAGGDAQFVARMNDTARRLGMTHTTYTDPSGFDATTVSTATDQVKLLSAVMAIPAFAETAGQQVLTIPNNPVRYATNALLGVDGVVAGKTGWTTAAGGNFVFAARKQVGSAQVLVVGAVMGQKGVPNSEVTVDSTKPLIEAAEQALTATTLVSSGAVVGEVSDGLGGTTPLVAGKDVSAVGWPGLTVRLNLAGSATAPRQAPEGRQLGAISLGGGQGAPLVPITLARALSSPGYLPRLTRLA